MKIKETRNLKQKDQRIFRGLSWKPEWFKDHPVNTNPDIPVPFALQRLLKKAMLPDNGRKFWHNTYAFVRLATRASFDLKRIWGTWYLVWYSYQALVTGRCPRVDEMLDFRERFLRIVEDWVGKKNDDLFRCSCCKTYKPRSQFFKDKHRANDVSSRCKTCLAAYKRSKRSGKPLELREEDRGIQYQSKTKRNREVARLVQDDDISDLHLTYEVLALAPDLVLGGLLGVEPKMYENPINDNEGLSRMVMACPGLLSDFLRKYKDDIVYSVERDIEIFGDYRCSGIAYDLYKQWQEGLIL